MIKNKMAGSRWLPVAIVLGAGIVVSIGIIALLVRLHDDLVKPLFSGLDQWLPQALHAHSSPLLTRFMLFLTTVGSPLCVVVYFLIALGILLLRRRWGEAIGITVSEIGALALNQSAKLFFHRHRPTFAWAFLHEKNYSFPSGHAMLGIISFGTIAFMLWRYYPKRGARGAIVIVAALLIFGIGLSRVYLGVHFPSDILAGWLAGGIWLVAVIVGTNVLHDVVPEVRPPDDQPQGDEAVRD